MTSSELKLQLFRKIDELPKDSLLELLEYLNEASVIQTADGKSLNQQEYKKEIDQAIAEGRNGKTISQDEMEKDL